MAQGLPRYDDVRLLCRCLLLCSVCLWCSMAGAQATQRLCGPDSEDKPGPACLVASQEIGALPDQPIYWRIYTYDDLQVARREAPREGAVAQAFGQTWLFVAGADAPSLPSARHVADVGPLPVAAGSNYQAEYLKSTFSPGMTAPLHVHSGPEAFYALSGGTCLETPDGVQVKRGAGHSLMIRQGPPMLLMAVGNEERRGFALILHDASHPPTTLTQAWTPKGLCVAEK